MKTLKTFINLFVLSALFSAAFAGNKIKAIKFREPVNGKARITVVFDEEPAQLPELTLKTKMIQLEIPGIVVWPKIDKRVSLKRKFDTTIHAYQFNKEIARVRANLTYDLRGKESQVDVKVNGNKVFIDFPALKAYTKTAPRKLIKTARKNSKVKAGSFDESYLEKLLKEKEKVPNVKLDTFFGKTKRTVPAKKTATDIVKTAQAGQKKLESFSLMGYVGKFIAFLALVLLIFYGVVGLMKKGVLKKGKLGFLNSTKAVEVLNTTFIAPKRTVLLVRAHNQVFLIGSSEKGLHQLGEITDVTGLIKTGEKDLSGSNYDSNYVTAETSDKEFKLKEMLEDTTEVSFENEVSNLGKVANKTVKDKVKLSDQIKKKVKNLKSLQ